MWARGVRLCAVLLALAAAVVACVCCVRRRRRQRREEVAKHALAMQPANASFGGPAMLPHAAIRSKDAAVDSAGDLYASSAFSRGGHGDAYSGESTKESFRLQVCCVLWVLPQRTWGRRCSCDADADASISRPVCGLPGHGIDDATVKGLCHLASCAVHILLFSWPASLEVGIVGGAGMTRAGVQRRPRLTRLQHLQRDFHRCGPQMSIRILAACV